MTDTTIPGDVISAAQAAAAKWKAPASVTIAQAILETGWFVHFPPDSNNYFGIKAVDGQPSVTVATREFVNDHYVTIQAAFRKFDSLADCFDAHGELLATNPVYAPCFQADGAEGFAQTLTGKYATDPNYGAELVSIMRAHNLEQYDLPPTIT